MSLKASALVPEMLAALRESLGRDFGKVRDFARPELQKLAQSLVHIGKLVAENKVTERQARALLKIHLNATQTVLLTVEGMGVIAIERALNAALATVRDAINTGVGFKLV